MAKPSSSATSDFRSGISISKLPDRKKLSGQADGEEVPLVHKGKRFFAVGAHCTDYGGTFADGLIVGDTVRCPLHHACFSLCSGEAFTRARARSIPCWKVEKVGEKSFVREKLAASDTRHAAASTRK
jgi:nitrite reductase/ring-hydroxylating ferredoxin subunit